MWVIRKVYIDGARELGVTPVLITPVERMYKGDKTHGEYPQTIRDLAEDESILLLDLQKKSFAEFNTYQSDSAITSAFSYDDNTHFSTNGAKIVAGWVKELACQSNEILCNQFTPIEIDIRVVEENDLSATNLILPTIIAPQGEVTEVSLTYQWQSVANATSYTLGMEDAQALSMWREYTVSSVEANCVESNQTCSYTPPETLSHGDTVNWWIKPSNASEEIEYDGEGTKFNIISSNNEATGTLDSEVLTTEINQSSSYDHDVFIPDLDFSQADVYGNGQVTYVSSSDELTTAVQTAEAKTTIIVKDGEYHNVSIRVPKGKHDITIKAEHKHAAKIIPAGREEGSMLLFSRATTTDESIHHINVIDLEIKGDGDSKKQFVKSEGGSTYSVHHIYFSGLKIHGLWMGLYSGLHSHDWTVDNSEMYDSIWSHMWYMMGWHQAVINSKFYNGSHDIIAIRGYYPDGEKHTYIGNSNDTSCHGNIYVEDRTERQGFIPADDWTHLIQNNQFLAWDMETPQRSKWNAHLGIAYGNYAGDAVCGAENVYLPPQNIVIADNIFSNEGEHPEAHMDAILVDARKGINNDDFSSINGISIYDNEFSPVNSDETFIEGNSQIDTIDNLNNIINN